MPSTRVNACNNHNNNNDEVHKITRAYTYENNAEYAASASLTGTKTKGGCPSRGLSKRLDLSGGPPSSFLESGSRIVSSSSVALRCGLQNLFMVTKANGRQFLRSELESCIASDGSP